MLRVSSVRFRTLVLAVAALALAGCRMDLVAPVEVAADGGATAGLSMRFDARMLAELDAIGVDPTAELGAAAASDPDWELVRTRDDDGGLTVLVTRTVADASEVGPLYRDLVAGLAPSDPALELDLEVELRDDGGHRVTGSAQLRPPRTVGLEVDGVPVGDDEDRLAALVQEHVTAAVEVGLPAPVASHDGIRLDRRSVRFDLEPGVVRTIEVEGEPPSWWARLDLDATTVMVIVGAGIVLTGGGLLLLGRRQVTREA